MRGSNDHHSRPGDRVSGWYLRVGRLCLAHRKIVDRAGRTRDSHTVLQWDRPAGREQRRSRWLLPLTIVAIGAPVSLWAARMPSPAAASLVIPLPPTVDPAPVARQRAGFVRKPAVVARKETVRASIVPTADDRGDMSAINRALVTALRQGEIQDWAAESGRQGLIVVGQQTESIGGRTCRETAILTQDGSFEGHTRSGRFCIDAAGRVSEASAQE